MSQHHPLQKRKNSGVTWIGDIPAHWQVARIKAISTLRNARQTELPTGALYIGLEDVESGSGSYRPTAGSSRKSDDSTVSIFRDRDVLYGKLRPYLKKAIVAQGDGACSTEFLVLDVESKGLVKPEWLHGWLLTHDVTQRIEAGCDGAKMPRASWEHVSSIHIPVPPPEEQAEILESLDGKTSRIDTLIAKKTRFIELLREKRQAVITKAVTKGLAPDVKLNDSGVDWIGSIPAGWKVAPIKYVAKLESGHTPSRSVPAYWENCTVPWFTLADIWQVRKAGRSVITETSEMVSELGLANSSARKLPAGTVVLSRTASVGFPAIIGSEMATSQDFAAWICRDGLHNEYLYFCLVAMRSELGRLMMGSTHKTIYMPDIEQLRCPLPPIDEQKVIASRLWKQTERVDSLVAKTERSIELLKEHRAALITAAVTGKIDVREAA